MDKTILFVDKIMRLLGITVCFTVLNVIDSNLRIFWGQNVNHKEYPYIGRLFILNNKTQQQTYSCTCTIIKPTWTLTAGHCVIKKVRKLQQRIVVYGPHYLSGNYSYSVVTGTHIHPSYPTKRIYNDIALLKTMPIVLERYGRLSAVDYTTLVGHSVRVFGFGLMNDGDKVGIVDQLGTKLQAIDVVIKKCLKVHEGCLALSPKCGDLSILCPGDSGGPVIHPSGVVAVNSFAPINLCRTDYKINKKITVDYSGGVVPVSRYIGWISYLIKSRQQL